FEEDTNIQQTFSERITARTKSAMPNALRAESAFKDFRPSQFTKRELEPRRYLAPGENLATALTGIVKNGVDRIRSETNRQGLRVEMTANFKSLLNKPAGEPRTQPIDLPAVLSILSTKLPAAPTLNDDPALTACAATLEVQNRLDEIEGTKSTPSHKKDTNSD